MYKIFFLLNGNGKEIGMHVAIVKSIYSNILVYTVFKSIYCMQTFYHAIKL